MGGLHEPALRALGAVTKVFAGSIANSLAGFVACHISLSGPAATHELTHDDVMIIDSIREGSGSIWVVKGIELPRVQQRAMVIIGGILPGINHVAAGIDGGRRGILRPGNIHCFEPDAVIE